MGSRPEIASPLNGLANLYTMQGKHSEAGLLFQRALSIREDALGEHHIDTAETLHNFAAYQEIQNKQ